LRRFRIFWLYELPRREADMPRPKAKPALDANATFVALDFETADYESDSACALALIRVERLEIVDRRVVLIKPPRSSFAFTFIHGITWQHVKNAPTFAETWPILRPFLDGATFLAAHNSGFDRKVMETCCAAARLEKPAHPYVCTVHLARKTWHLRSNRLPDVCNHLGLKLKHHDAGSDAEACARIVIAAIQTNLATV
jgi:DNA polymerase-3 subunit epsilon